MPIRTQSELPAKEILEKDRKAGKRNICTNVYNGWK